MKDISTQKDHAMLGWKTLGRKCNKDFPKDVRSS